MPPVATLLDDGRPEGACAWNAVTRVIGIGRTGRWILRDNLGDERAIGARRMRELPDEGGLHPRGVRGLDAVTRGPQAELDPIKSVRAVNALQASNRAEHVPLDRHERAIHGGHVAADEARAMHEPHVLPM